MLFYTSVGARHKLNVRVNFSTDVRVNFKLFGATGMMFIFVLLQAMAPAKYADEEKEKKPMLYAIIGQDIPDSLEKRMAARPAHVARLQALQEEGRLLVAGPFPAVDAIDPAAAGFSGSLIVAEFAALQDAETWAQADPYVAAGVYAQVVVKPFRKTFPA